MSGEGGTGKSYLIHAIRAWVKKELKGMRVAVSAPTGIAAYNVNGLTLHRIFQLPVEHGGTPKYSSLSNEAFQVLREKLKEVVLFIINEVSMISNITFMYIHLRLCEIFNTSDTENKRFREKHILLFGDLLQLPPVNENLAYEMFTKDQSSQ